MNKWIFLILTLIMATSGFSDTVVLKNQNVFKGAWVVSFKNDPQSGAVLLGHTIEDNKLSETAYPLTPDQITSVTFNWIGEDGYSTESRQANLILQDGKSFQGVDVSHGELSNNSFGFYIRTPNGENTSEFFFVSASSIQSLDFLPTSPPIEMYFNAELGDFYMRHGEHHWELNALEKGQLNTLSAEEIENIPGMTRESMEELVENIFEGNTASAWNGLTIREYYKWSDLDDEADNQGKNSSSSDSNPKRKKRTLSKSILNFILGTAILVYLFWAAVCLIPNILVLKLVCLIESVKDVSWKNLAICAVGLATVPPFVTYFSYHYLLCIIPFFGGIFALFVYFMVSRSIVMGSMEVLETQAGIIVVVDIVFRIALILYFGLNLLPIG